MKLSIDETIKSIHAGETVTLRQPWYHRVGYLALTLALSFGGYFAISIGFTFGWLFLILGGFGTIVWSLSWFMPRPAIQMDDSGLTIVPQEVLHKWWEVSNFFVSSGEIGDHWVSFRTITDDPDSSYDPTRNVDIASSFGFQPQALADFLNGLRVAFAETTLDDEIIG